MPIGGKGVYLLLLSLPFANRVSVGRLGTFYFPAGFYFYVGSAMGPGGLRSRLDRHIRREKRMHWHIDYLRLIAEIEEIWLQVTRGRVECRWAAAAQSLPEAKNPVPRFGASDCRCTSHLIHLTARPKVSDFATAAGIPLAKIQVIGYDENRN